MLKTIQGTEYVYIEYPLKLLNPNNFTWSWTTTKEGKRGAGLQGKINDEVNLVWYKKQKQLLKRRIIPSNSIRIQISRTRLDFDEYINGILNTLKNKSKKFSNDFENNDL